VERYLSGADRDKLDPILDTCVAEYLNLDEDGQVDFKGKAKAFLRTYNFLSAILPYSSVEWEKLSIFLNFLVPKLPAPIEEDLSKGILQAVDMDSYRVEKQTTMKLLLLMKMQKLSPYPLPVVGINRSQNWTACQISSENLTTFTETFSGRIKTGCTNL